MKFNLFKEKRSIKTKIFITILILILSILSIITLSFNKLVHRYIETMSNEELDETRQFIDDKDFKKLNDYVFDEEEKRNFTSIMNRHKEPKKKERPLLDSEFIIIDKKYNIVHPKDEKIYINNFYDYKGIIDIVKERNINLNLDNNIQIKTNDKNYYISFIKLNNEYCLVVFVDVSNIIGFANKMNILLGIIMLIASMITILAANVLAKNIADPIENLGNFAKQLGEGDFTKCNCNFFDKELAELAEVMNKSAEKLDKYDKEQRIFFQNVSHELRTPLMCINGYAEAIKYGMVDKEEAGSIILEEGKRLEELIEELLYLSRIDNITKNYTLSEQDLREIISNCIVKQKTISIKKNIDIILEFDEKPVLFICDEKSIYRVFVNIIDNSLRYAKRKIIVKCINDAENILISIKNDGELIRKDDMPHIFNRFYKGYKGKNGIGLSIVKTIVEQHNGEVYAENCNDFGVQFVIKF